MDIDTFASLSSGELLLENFLTTLQRLTFDKKRSWLTDRLRRSSDGVTGTQVQIPYLTKTNWPWRATDLQDGYTPTGSPLDGKRATLALTSEAALMWFGLAGLAGAGTVGFKAIKDCEGDAAAIDLLSEQLKALGDTFPYAYRNNLWTPSSGILGRGNEEASGSVVTLDNDGLWATNVLDRAKLFEVDMWVQIIDGTTLAAKGAPVQITAVDKKLGKITLSDVTNYANNDYFVPSDQAGLEVSYGKFSPGLLDVIDDDNTFQGINRSLAANSRFRAQMKNASNAALTYDTASDFFYDCHDPKFAITDYRVIREYWKDNQRSNIRFEQGSNYADGYRAVTIDKTQLVADEDAHVDKVLVVDLDNIMVADAGAFQNLRNEGWVRVPGRYYLEYIVVYWMLLYGIDVRYSGQLYGINYSA